MTFHKYLGDSKMFEYDKHFRECQQLNKPFIKARVNPNNENYHVEIDLITCNYNLTKEEQEEIIKLFREEMIFTKSSLDTKKFSMDEELAWFDGIPSEHVENFCNNLYDLTQKYHV
ncbi:MAG: hypothetical protein KJO99_01865 [Nitrosopumilus sp.]|nr:hypothetical protein [Nitrosopumilus sp.]MBT8251566.1 hypothetical protein [Nitrosopumilus sp.]NNL52737.1 hypothetical protein [Nitrosopumilus sp.]